MKALEEMTAEELLALAKAKDAELIAKQQELDDAAKVVDKLKGQVADSKAAKKGKTTVKYDGKTYAFPTESWTEPNPELGGETLIVKAAQAVEDKEYIAELVKRKFLVEVKK